MRVLQSSRTVLVSRLAAFMAAALVVGALVAVSPAATPAAHADAVNPIMGGARLTPNDISTWFKANTKVAYRASVPIETLAQLFIDEGFREGVRGDIAFAQSILETGWFNFPDNGQVRPADNNFAGIGACNSCNGGYKFADARTGVRAQIQHLRNYADKTPASGLTDPPILPNYDGFVYHGKAPNWEDLNGKWAVPGTTYAQGILAIYARMLTFGGVGPNCAPDSPLGSLQAAGKGYWEVAPDGGIFTFGSAAFYGSTGALRLKAPVLGMAATPNGGGYWLYAKDGGIFTFGNAGFFGSTGALRLVSPVVAMAPTPSGNGYWMAAGDGGVFSFGDAAFYGSMGGLPLNKPIVGMASTPSGHGYWLVASDGGIFTFGDAAFYGSAGAIKLAQPVVAMARTASGTGYWMLGRDGGIFTFGDAKYLGGLAQCPNRVATAIQGTATSNGYWISSAEGRMATFGDARHYGWAFVTNVAPVGFTAIN
ncbi:MAG: estA [Actinomycetia bacterium]|nr:estA [Actinomycetes bacterium]